MARSPRTPTADDLLAALAALGEVVREIPADRMTLPTPCPPWDVATLVGHALAAQRMWLAAVGADTGVTPTEVLDPRPIEGDPAAALAEVTGTAARLWGDAVAADRPLATPFGPLEPTTAVAFPTVDAAAHAWDLARAVGLPDALDDRALEALEVCIPVAVNDLTRQLGLFGPAVEVGPKATRTERLMAATGRDPR